MKILAFVPARGGSKSIKNKNMVLLNRKPLIFYTLNILKKLKKNTTPFISTDNKKIKKYCEKMGFKNNYVRPKNLSKDKSNIVDAIKHALNWFENKKIFFDTVLLLQPTTPLRDLNELKSAINFFKKKKLKSLVSVTKMKEHPYECMKFFKNKWSYLVKNPSMGKGRQSYKKNFYFIDGAFYFVDVKFLIKNKKFVHPNHTKIFVQKNTYPIDIDNKDDLLVSGSFLKKS